MRFIIALLAIILAISPAGCANKGRQPVFADTAMSAGNALGGGSPVAILICLTIGLAADLASIAKKDANKQNQPNRDTAEKNKKMQEADQALEN